jgi:N-acetylmuramoyl-L-alanine amidase
MSGLMDFRKRYRAGPLAAAVVAGIALGLAGVALAPAAVEAARPTDAPASSEARHAAPLSKVAQAPITVPGPIVAMAPPMTRRRVVVVDAGHGGADAGARGGHAREKDVTLAAARALKARLERGGHYSVVLTRDADAYVPLERRVEIARRAEADLFISLHADAGAEADLRGASVYTLSEEGADRAAKMMATDDRIVRAVGPGGDKAVSQIVLDLTQRSTKTRSAAFAEVLLDKVGRTTPLLNRSHRDGGFAVLLAPEVPAVLLEMGFMTSPADERLLTRVGERQRMIDAVGDAIDAYFEKHVRMAAG